MNNNTNDEIKKIQKEITELNQKLFALRKNNPPVEIKNYFFQSQTGKVSLLDLFADKDQLIVIHNMGQGCRYCTLWADGFNAFVPHLESTYAVALVSKDDPETQRLFANSRKWQFRMYSHGGGDYIREQSVEPGGDNVPGIATYERKGDKIFKKNISNFGPGDQFCSLWHIISLLGASFADWTPQFNYWTRPKVMDDDGKNLKD